MSDQKHLDDEQLSALFDGLGPAADEAHAATCPDCAARLSLWRDAMQLIAGPPMPSETIRQAAIGAALEASAPAAPAEPAAGAISLVDRRRQVAARLLTPGRLGAAAAVLVVAALIGVVAVNGTHGSHNHQVSASAKAKSAVTSTSLSPSGSGTQTNVGAGSASAGISGATPSRVAPPGTSQMGFPSSSTTTALIMQAGLGSFDSTSDLVPVVQARLRHPVGATVSSSEFGRCSPDAATLTGEPADTVTMEAPLTYRGLDALAYVLPQRGRYALEILTPLTCGVVASANF